MKSNYVAKKPDGSGYVYYTESEHNVWKTLYTRQYQLIKENACNEYLSGFNELNISIDTIPQLPKINKILKSLTGWQLEPATGIISFDYFFKLLAEKKFPAATFIRHLEDLDFTSEPDIFHEIIGHCPLLANEQYADFSNRFGKLGCKTSSLYQTFLARLYWFTAETGLFATESGFKVYGGATLSSYSELQYAVDSDEPMHLAMDILDMLRTPYRFDTLPCVYFHIESMDELSELSEGYITSCVRQANKLGLFPSLYPTKLDQAM